jgi:16S rRNA (guanine527-N7)-methyltransferase
MIHVKRGPSLERDAAAIGLSLDEDARSRLRELEGLLADKATEIGLISPSDADRVYERHILDCLRAAPLLLDADGVLIDVGSGAGLPGLVLACARPDLGVTLVDSRRRAGAFLELAVHTLGLPRVDVRLQRVQELVARADVATARAFAPLERSWEAAYPLLRPGGRLIYFAGESLTDPGRAAAEANPSPARVETRSLIATMAPLVIMSRGG